VPIWDAAACAGLLDGVTAVALRAAAAIRAAGTGSTRIKADGSPVSAADEAAETAIVEGLSRLAPAVPIVSEEQAARERPVIDASTSYFLVDPLDGTREFIAGRDEYAINIAVVTRGIPILGVIAAPAIGLVWRGIVGHFAERIAVTPNGDSGRPSPIHSRPRRRQELIVLVSRSHLEARTQAFLQRLPQAQLIPSGSAVKFCRIAEGSADLYPRLAPTRDWDVAAGHAIVAAAGGKVLTPEGGPLSYGTADLRIPGFIAAGDPAMTP
jgi:3'(2'), 5'-bisphosphate nucleotidase